MMYISFVPDQSARATDKESSPLHSWVPRRLILAVLALPLLVGQAPVAGQATCLSPEGPGPGRPLLFDEAADPGPDGLAPRFQVKFAADGTARVRGTIHLKADAERRVLEGEGGGAQVECSDLDGDGSAGLVRLEAEFRDVRADKRVRVVLEAQERDIAASGIYPVSVHIGGLDAQGDVEVRLRDSDAGE